ncbi:MAG: hypothetical protein SNJ58_15005 [Aggregatilineales bacterium]
MHRLLVFLTAALVFAPHPLLADDQGQLELVDSLPQADFLPIPTQASPASMAPLPKPFLMLGLLAAFSQWRLPSSGGSTLTSTSTPVAQAADGHSCNWHARLEALIVFSQLSSYHTATGQPHRRAPPQTAR